MANSQKSATFQHVRTLFNVGAVGALSDGQLLEWLENKGSEAAELALTALVERHGPMVRRVCRSVLSDPNDADDAFQATFLVLVRRARSLWVHDSLGPWLHQVAYRTAICARSAAARRWRHETAASISSSRASDASVDAHDLADVLHGEVSRLPDHYRRVIVLCLLEGLTHAQAAEQLGWPAGTIQSRLARGKALLRDRLTRRGLAPCALVSGGLVSSDATATMLTPALVAATSRTATLFSVDRAAIPVSVIRLANQVIRSMLILRLRTVMMTIVPATLIWGAGVYSATQVSEQEPSTAKGVGGAVDPHGQTHGLDPDHLTLDAPRELKVRAGRDTLLLYALDKNGQRLAPTSGGTFKESSVEMHWVVITGVLNHQAVCERLRQGRGEKSSEVHPDYRRLELERQELAPGADWSAWSKVDRDKICRILRNLPETGEERTPAEVRLPALVDPLPFLKVDVWDGFDIKRLIQDRKVEIPVQVLAGRDSRRSIATTTAPEIMVRAFDFTVVPGLHYRYRVRIVIDGSDGMGQRHEVFGAWSKPTAEVAMTD